MDRNVVQAPELIRQLTSRLGVREAHITPTLNEGIQAVVVLDTLSGNSRPSFRNLNLNRVVTISTIAFGVQVASNETAVAITIGGVAAGVTPVPVGRLRRLRVSTADAGVVRVKWGFRVGALGIAGAGAVQVTSTEQNVPAVTTAACFATNFAAGSIGMQTVLGDEYITAGSPLVLGSEAGVSLANGYHLLIQTLNAALANGQTLAVSAAWDIEEYGA